MSNIPITSLPLAISLSGSEVVPGVQGGTTKQIPISLINSSNPANLPAGGLTGQALVKQTDADYDTEWLTATGIGTVQEVDTGTGLTGGPITLTGTVALASIATGNVLANVSGGSAAPTPNTPSSVLDVIGSTRGDVLYRGASGWSALAPGTAGQILSTGGAGADPSWSAAGAGTTTSVGLSLPAIFTVSGSPVTTSGTLTGTLANQSANQVWSGPTAGAAAAPAFRALVGADLPNPSSSSLGGIQSTTGAASQWISTISTSGVPGLSQPAFSDLSGSISLSQFGNQTANRVLAGPASGGATTPTFRAIVGADLPNPSSTTLGGVQSLAAVTSRWINTISTSGVPSASQPSFTDISGTVQPSQLPSIGNNNILGNVSGGTAVPVGITASNILDILGSTQGDVLYRGSSGWAALTAGTNGQVLTTSGAAANPAWTTVTGTGTVTSVATNNGITGGTITTTGTIGLDAIANGTLLANTSGLSQHPTATAPTAILDVIGSTQGNLLYRGASNWTVLAPGTNGQVLTQGASTPSWSNAGTVSTITPSSGLTSTVTSAAPGSAITTTGTLYASQIVNAQTGTSYAIVDGDRAKLITATNAAAQAYTIAQAGAASAFQSGWHTNIQNNSTNVAGVITITPTTSTINGAATLVIQPGQSVRIVSDGTNYQAFGLGSGKQLPGTTTSDAANAGNIGEYVESELAIGSATSLVTSIAKTITSISLTAGDWDVRGNVGIYPANTTSLTKSLGGVSTVTNSIGSASGRAVGGLFPPTVFDGNTANYSSIAPCRFSLSTTTTVYLVGLATFTVSTCSAFGIISARRVR